MAIEARNTLLPETLPRMRKPHNPATSIYGDVNGRLVDCTVMSFVPVLLL